MATPSTACGSGNISPLLRNRIGAQTLITSTFDEEIADTASAAKKRALCLRKETLENDHNAKTDEERADEDTGRLEEWKTENRLQAQQRLKLKEDKKKLFFFIWANMSEISPQKVKEHLTVPVRLDLEFNSQDPCSMECNQSNPRYCETRQ